MGGGSIGSWGDGDRGWGYGDIGNPLMLGTMGQGHWGGTVGTLGQVWGTGVGLWGHWEPTDVGDIGAGIGCGGHWGRDGDIGVGLQGHWEPTRCWGHRGRDTGGRGDYGDTGQVWGSGDIGVRMGTLGSHRWWGHWGGVGDIGAGLWGHWEPRDVEDNGTGTLGGAVGTLGQVWGTGGGTGTLGTHRCWGHWGGNGDIGAGVGCLGQWEPIDVGDMGDGTWGTWGGQDMASPPLPLAVPHLRALSLSLFCCPLPSVPFRRRPRPLEEPHLQEGTT